MPPTTGLPKPRKTTDIRISPEEWTPVQAWLQHCSNAGIPETRLGLHTETQAAIKRVTASAKRTPPTANIRLRLPNELANDLAEQVRFWESCMDELPQTAREHSPNPLTFLELALDLEASIKESKQTPSSNGSNPTCQTCGKPVPSAGTATVNLDSRGIVITTYKHRECT